MPEGQTSQLDIVEWLGPVKPDCTRCKGQGWVCAEHTKEAFSDAFGCQVCTLGGSEGVPCPDCRPHCHLIDQFVGPLRMGEA